MNLTLVNKHHDYFLNKEKCKNLIELLQDKEDIKVNSMTIVVSTDDHLNQLKKEFYDQDLLTDTISFNLNEDVEPVEGEIYLSADRIEENAEEYENSFEFEFANVLIHSILHTFGYEDESQKKQEKMFELQREYLEKFPYQNLIQKD